MESGTALKPCPSCGHMCPDDVVRCPNCDAQVRRFVFKATPIVPGGGDPKIVMPRVALIVVIGAIVVLLFMLYVGSK